MQITRKDATVTATGDDGPGTFEAILSAPTKDRDGETLLPEEWKQPLPDRINVDVDHGMSVASTIGSARPWIDDVGNLRISGTFASTPKAQEVRTLMREGHINTTSVAFISEKTQKDGKPGVQREVLNAAIVAIPSNREALVLASKALGRKLGARNSATDAAHIQTAHDSLVAAGAACPTPGKAWRKAMGDGDMTDPVAMLSACDAAIDSALDLLTEIDPATLPAEVQQAIALIQAADASMDELMAAAGQPDPDESGEPAAAADDAAADVAAAKSTAAADADTLALHNRALQAQVAAFALE